MGTVLFYFGEAKIAMLKWCHGKHPPCVCPCVCVFVRLRTRLCVYMCVRAHARIVMANVLAQLFQGSLLGFGLWWIGSSAGALAISLVQLVAGGNLCVSVHVYVCACVWVSLCVCACGVWWL